MRVVLVAPEEPFVLPTFFGELLPAVRDEIAAVAIVSPVFTKSSRLAQAKKFARAFGLRALAVEGAWFARHKAADLAHRILGLGRPHSVKGHARAHGLRVLAPKNVNSAEFLAELRRIDPDTVISVSCPQIFGLELLALPRLGCVNVHSGLLPDYRGVLPTFWAMSHGESHTGVTVHYMTPGIDDGGIILQRPVPIRDGDTLHELMRRCKVVAAELVIETLARMRHDDVAVKPNHADEGSYFSFPTRADVERFRAAGRCLR